MPDSDESCTIIRPASHTTALGELFIADEWERAQGGSWRGGSLEVWCGRDWFGRLIASPSNPVLRLRTREMTWIASVPLLATSHFSQRTREMGHPTVVRHTQ